MRVEAGYILTRIRPLVIGRVIGHRLAVAMRVSLFLGPAVATWIT